MNEKRVIGEKAAEFVKDGMIVGLGTGSTVFYTIAKLGQLLRDGLLLKGVATSVQTEKLARQWGIPLVGYSSEIDEIDVAIDGADEVDSEWNLIKGGGGALVREKMIAKTAKAFIVIADSSKFVGKLGNFPLPVEVVPFGYEMTRKHLAGFGCEPKLREIYDTPFKTDNGNYIFDCSFPEILEPAALERDLNLIPGVVDNGLFVKMVDTIITLDSNRNIIITR
ncbi:ribose-5-phosphate isomerase RpiA [Bacillus canaveralius]|uniref:ribose-5-phosphate isomerase RpiA n=1 Tax=Bacillus canaveralius TaxID=1403243 RepID=UPI000F79EA61|nr:ribose-5-phosphate isomerase RpiA [Bacillus canaveralius]RSK47863.1 ribose-5-phosphate isomerase RpiA [Bacillus canaveralius]